MGASWGEFKSPIGEAPLPACSGALEFSKQTSSAHQRIGALVIPEMRSLILDRNTLNRRHFCDPGSRFAWPG